MQYLFNMRLIIQAAIVTCTCLESITRMMGYGPVQSVVLDWAGTAVDHGCTGPAAVCVNVFEQVNVAVSTADARRFTGLAKKDHIREMCGLPDVSAAVLPVPYSVHRICLEVTGKPSYPVR